MQEGKPVIIQGDGSSLWTATFNKDFAIGFTGIMGNRHAIGDKSVSVVFDNSKLKRAVPDMKTTVRFDQGVRIALDYIMAHPELQVEDPEFDSWCDKVIEALESAKNDI